MATAFQLRNNLMIKLNRCSAAILSSNSPLVQSNFHPGILYVIILHINNKSAGKTSLTVELYNSYAANKRRVNA